MDWTAQTWQKCAPKTSSTDFLLPHPNPTHRRQDSGLTQHPVGGWPHLLTERAGEDWTITASLLKDLLCDLQYMFTHLSTQLGVLLVFIVHSLREVYVERYNIPGLYTEGAPLELSPRPQSPPPRKLYSLILMHDTVAVPHKLLPPPPHPHQNILYKTLYICREIKHLVCVHTKLKTPSKVLTVFRWGCKKYCLFTCSNSDHLSVNTDILIDSTVQKNQCNHTMLTVVPTFSLVQQSRSFSAADMSWCPWMKSRT